MEVSSGGMESAMWMPCLLPDRSGLRCHQVAIGSDVIIIEASSYAACSSYVTAKIVSAILALERLSLWRLVLGNALEADVVQDALRTAQEELSQYPLQPKQLAAAKHEAEQVLRKMVEPTGWTCAVLWAEPAEAPAAPSPS